MIYILLISIPLLLILSFIFFMIASMDGAMFGTPEHEIDNIITDKMNSIIAAVDKESNGAM